LGFYIPKGEAKAGEEVEARLYICLKRQKFSDEDGDGDGTWVEDDNPDDWDKNLQVNLPNLEFCIRYGNDEQSANLFTYEHTSKGAGAWALSRPMAEILAGLQTPKDPENKDNPFNLYTAPALPEPDKAIPLGKLAEALNGTLFGGKEGPLFFDYKIELSSLNGEDEDGEILLYPEMLKKKIVASVDILMLVPMIFQANPAAEKPVAITFDPDLGGEDLFRRKTPEDNAYFDMVTSFGFDIVVKNGSVLSAGKLFLENKTDDENPKYRLPIVDFTGTRNNLILDSAEMEKIKAIWPFIPRMSIEFNSGQVVRIKRNFNIELQSVTVRAGGEYTFETGL
jgi:hypothetical protein